MTVLARTRTWLGASTNRRILGATATLAGISLAVRAASLAKDSAVAFRFGTDDSLDAFLIALVLPTFAMNVVANSLNSAFVPILIEVRERDGFASARRLFRSVLTTGLLILVSATFALGLLFRRVLPYIAYNFPAEKAALTYHIFGWLLPVVILSGLVTLLTGVLNATERFALGAVVPVAVPLTTAAAVIAAGPRWGIMALAGGTVVGYALNAALIALAARRSGWSVMPAWFGLTPELRRIVALYGPVIAGSCLMGTTTLVDQAMASSLAPGSVAALSYGNKLVSVLAGLLSMSLATAVLPHFSRMVARMEWSAVRHTLTTWVRAITWATVLPSIVLALASRPVVRLAFERGAFSAHDTAVVSAVQAMFVLQVPFFAIGILFVQLLTAMQLGRTLLWGAGINVVVNVALNYAFMQRLGVAGIALSTTVMYAISCGFLGWHLRRALSAAEAASPAGETPSAAVVACQPS